MIGSVGQLSKSEAERKKKEFLATLNREAGAYRIPSVMIFADAVRHYREVFAPEMLRESTFIVADHYLRKHLEPDWNDTPIDHITIERVNEWAKRKRREGLSWVSVKNILRTMQRVLSAFSKDQKPPFSLQGLKIPQRDKLQMQMRSRNAVSFSWEQSVAIAEQTSRLEGLDPTRRDRYRVLFTVAAASGLRCSELFALRVNDLDFKAGTIRVDESAENRTGAVGPCKNVAAYRTVVLADDEGRQALQLLQQFVGGRNGAELVFSSKLNTPLRETNVLHEALHPTLAALSLPRAGMHAFRHGCNRRWELAGMNPAILRQQMGHSSETMTARYTGQIPLEQVRQHIWSQMFVTNCDQSRFEVVA